MSLADTPATSDAGQGAPWVRVGLAAGAILLIAACIGVAAWLLVPATAHIPAARNPFAGGLREAAPAASGFGAYILALQGSFYRLLQGSISDLKLNGAYWSLLGIGFAYGAFHAAGPGHGKTVIGAYIVANERALIKGISLSLAAAVVQAIVAVLLVAALSIVLRATAATISGVASGVELASFAVLTAVGVMLTWRKAGKLVGITAMSSGSFPDRLRIDCDHVHLPAPAEFERLTRWRELIG